MRNSVDLDYSGNTKHQKNSIPCSLELFIKKFNILNYHKIELTQTKYITSMTLY